MQRQIPKQRLIVKSPLVNKSYTRSYIPKPLHWLCSFFLQWISPSRNRGAELTRNVWLANGRKDAGLAGERVFGHIKDVVSCNL